MIWNESNKAFAPQLDPHGRSSIRDILVAGDAAGIGGAQEAELEGQAVSLNALADLGLIDTYSFWQRQKQVQIAFEKYQRDSKFIDALYVPESQLLIPVIDSTLVFRCEEVTAGTLHQVIELGLPDPINSRRCPPAGWGSAKGGCTVQRLPTYYPTLATSVQKSSSTCASALQ